MAVDLKTSLSQQLNKIVASISPEDVETTLSTLRKIFDNIIQCPNDDRYRQIKLANKTFNSKVWRYSACEKLMKMSGWVVVNDHVRLKDDSHVHTVSQLLESLHKAVTTTGPSVLDGKNIKILSAAFLSKEIGIVRILITDFGADANSLDEEGSLCFFELFKGCDSSENCQSLIINFIKEFGILVNKKSVTGDSAIHLAVLHKLSTVIRFLVDECSIDVNQPMPKLGGTPLHMAYATDQLSIAKLLIEHKADQDAIDENGKKPHEYRGDGENTYYRLSFFYIKCRKLFYKLVSKERVYYQELRDKGTPEIEAVCLTFENFPTLRDEVIPTHPLDLHLEATPTMNKLNHYITDMAPSYYPIGLELGIPNVKLKSIKHDPGLPDLQEKCRKMLEVWLETDTSASWKKMCDALEEDEVSLHALAKKIKTTV